MKICGACGIEFDKEYFSNIQWRQSKQKRRCKQCVDKREVTSEPQAKHGGAGDRKEPQPPVPVPIADDGARAGVSSEEQTDNDEICGICLDVFDNPVQLS